MNTDKQALLELVEKLNQDQATYLYELVRHLFGEPNPPQNQP